MSAYRLRWGESGLVLHMYEPRGHMTVHEDDGTTAERTLMRALCRRRDLGSWCDDGNLDMAYPPITGEAVPDDVCPACKKAAGDRARPVVPDTPSLLDMLEVAA